MSSRYQTGFTLVEMLVALSVASLLLGLVYGAVRVGQRSVSAMEAQVDRSESVRISWQFLSSALSEAMPMPNPDDEEDLTSFSGTENSLAFVADSPPYLGLGGLMVYRLEVEEDIDGDRLRLTRQRYDSEEMNPDAPVEEAVLVEALEDIQISYFGYTAEAETPEWHPEWIENEILPTLVQVKIVPADGMTWPTLIARPAKMNQMPEGDQPAEGQGLESEADRAQAPHEGFDH